MHDLGSCAHNEHAGSTPAPALWRGATIGSELAWKTSGSVYSDWGFEVFVPLRSSLNARPPDEQRPSTSFLTSADMQRVKAGSL